MNAEQIRREIRDIISYEVQIHADMTGIYMEGQDDAATEIMRFIGPLLKYEEEEEEIRKEALRCWLADGWLEQDFEEKGAFYRDERRRLSVLKQGSG